MVFKHFSSIFNIYDGIIYHIAFLLTPSCQMPVSYLTGCGSIIYTLSKLIWKLFVTFFISSIHCILMPLSMRVLLHRQYILYIFVIALGLHFDTCFIRTKIREFSYNVFFIFLSFAPIGWFSSVPSVLCRCWSAGRASGLEKTVWWGADVVICMERGADLHMPLPLASVKSRLVLPFWYRLTWVVKDNGPLNVCVCACVSDSLCFIRHTKQHLDWYSHLSTAHGCDQQTHRHPVVIGRIYAPSACNAA